jgi:hypothetical protein
MIIPPDDNLPDVTYTGGAAPCSGDVVVSPIVSKPPFS